MTNQIRVMVVDDSTFMRGALVRMIEKDPRFKVIDVAVNGAEGVEKAARLKPDVITMDVEMPIMNGLEALERIMQTTRIPVIMVSTLTEAGAQTTMKALELGAVDFIPKSLNDKDKNIFKGAEEIHAKIAAAAGVSNGRAEMIAQQPPVKAPPLPEVSTLTRVNARLLMIGSSTGGPKALQVLLSQLPGNLPVPVVIAQHMPPQFTLALAKRLDETCAPTVVEAESGMPLQPGKVYIAQGGSHMRISAASLKIDAERGESPYKPSVDVLAESAREVFGKQVLAVMLTGMGADGAREYKKLRDMGAHIIAQDMPTSVVYGMPKAVLENGAANEVLPLEKIGPRIRTLLGV